MATPLEQLRWERRRKMQVRESFSAGLGYHREQGQGKGQEPGEFYRACADYLIDGQRRLIDQDRRLVNMLMERVPRTQSDDHEAMKALCDRLDLADRTLAEFSSAVSEYCTRGPAGTSDFERAADRFIDVLVNVLGARSHSLRHLTTTLLGEDDWQRIAGITPEFMKAEGAAFAAIGRLAPRGLGPENMLAQGRPETQSGRG